MRLEKPTSSSQMTSKLAVAAIESAPVSIPTKTVLIPLVSRASQTSPATSRETPGAFFV